MNNSSAPLCDQSVAPGEPLHVNLGKHRKKKETGFEATIEQSRQLANHCRRLHSEHQSEPRGEKEEVEMLWSFFKVLDYVETNNIVTTCASPSRYGTDISIQHEREGRKAANESKAGYYKIELKRKKGLICAVPEQ